MRFSDPVYLLLFVPAVLGLAVSFRHVRGMMRARRLMAFLLRLALVSCLILALAGPEWRQANEGLCTLFVVDFSDSVKDSDRRTAERFVEEAMGALGPADQAGVVVFGKDPAFDSAPSTSHQLGRILTKVNGAASDLASAIRLASAGFPDGKARRIVVLSDGNETSGDAAEAAQVAATQGIRIDFVPLGSQTPASEASIVDMQSPTEVPQGQPFNLRVAIDSAKSTNGRLVIDRDGDLVSEQQVRLSPGTNLVTVSQTLSQTGFSRYRATLYAAGDADARNNVGMSFVQVRGKPKVLILSNDPGKSPLARILAQQGITADSFGPDALPTRPEEVQQYDAVIFNDLNASNLLEPQMKMLQAAIRDTGVGFAMVGGENSFLSGGYYGSPIAEALPVDLNIRQRKTFPSTSILIVADASGSMSMIEDGMQKIQLAAKAAEQTVNMMAPTDRVGVAGSTDGIEFVAPMQTLTDKAAVISQIRRLSTGGGGIYCNPSLQFAYKELRAENTKVRHFILLADGADCDLQEGCVEMAAEARREKITTSVVAIGDGPHVPFLKAVAAAAGGRFYLANRAGQLPAIFTQDAAVMSRSAIEEGAFLPRSVAGEEILSGIDPGSIPPLLAYCLTEGRPLARVGMKTNKDDPLLAVWQYGLGQSLAFTSDAQPRWAQRWVPWPGFGTFWAQAVRAVSRRLNTGDMELKTRHDGARGQIELLASDATGSPLNGLEPSVRVATPDGNSMEVRLNQTAPGTYTGVFETPELGTYIVAYGQAGSGRIATSGVSLPYPAEYRSFRPNRPLLERIAQETGGQALTEPAQVARPLKDPGFSLTELAALFLLLSALLLPLDVAARRVAIPFAEIWAKVMARVAERRGARKAPIQQEVVIGRLQKAKERTRLPSPDAAAPRETTGAEIGSKPVESAPEKPMAPSSQGSVGSRLLDAKRRRGEKEDGPKE